MKKNGKLCPNCVHDVGYWRIIRMPYPSHFKCKHCGETLAYETKGWPIALVFTIVYLSIIGFIVVNDYLESFDIILSLFIVVSMWIPFEIIMTFVLRHYHHLRVVKQ